MDTPSPPPPPPPRPGRALALLAAGLLTLVLGGAAAWWARPASRAGGDAAPVTSAPTGRLRSEVRLEAAGPGVARVLVDGKALGEITRAADGTVHGEALGRLAFQSRRLAGRDVELVRDPAVDVELALGVQRLLAAGAVAATLVEPDARRP